MNFMHNTETDDIKLIELSKINPEIFGLLIAKYQPTLHLLLIHAYRTQIEVTGIRKSNTKKKDANNRNPNMLHTNRTPFKKNKSN